MKNFFPPVKHIQMADKETIEKIKNIDEKEFKKSYAYKKYVKPLKDREKSYRKSKRSNWWKNNWIAITALIIAIITLIATIIFELLQLQN